MDDRLVDMEFAYLGHYGSETYRVEGCYATFVPGVFATLGVRVRPEDEELLKSLALAGVDEGDTEAVIVLEFSNDRKSITFRTVSSFPFSGVWNHEIATQEVGSPEEFMIVNGQVRSIV